MLRRFALRLWWWLTLHHPFYKNAFRRQRMKYRMLLHRQRIQLLRNYEASLDEKTACLKKGYDQKVGELKSKVDAIANAASKINWRRHGQYYQLHMMFDPNVFGPLYPDEMDMMSKHFGRMVEAEIASRRFVTGSIEDEYKHIGFKYNMADYFSPATER